MGKRKVYTEEYIRKKIRKLQKKLEKPEQEEEPAAADNDETAASSATMDSTPVFEELTVKTAATMEATPLIPVQDCMALDEEQLPEEFLLALGHEGEETTVVGEPIRPELALRWTNIMNTGLGKETREQLLKKYHTPGNFMRAVAPVLNPEIEAAVSELTSKRDKRIINRQNMVGKLMSTLGGALSNVLKGDINTKKLIEQVNDAAKIAAEVFYQDSCSRRFFALAGATPLVREAVRTTTTDEFLFGKECAEKIKAAQTIIKTGSQIKNVGTVPTKIKSASTPKVQGNWRGPPRYQQQQSRATRGGHRQAFPPPKKYYNQLQRQKEQKHQAYHRQQSSYRR